MSRMEQLGAIRCSLYVCVVANRGRVYEPGRVSRKMGISEQTFYRWKKNIAGMGVAETRRLKQHEEENRKL